MPPTYLALIPDAEWPRIIDNVLAHVPRAYETLRAQVAFFVEHAARLRIGTPGEDGAVRRRIARKVVRILEDGGFASVQEWRARQTQQRDHATWWGWIKALARVVAVEDARTPPAPVTPPRALGVR